MYEISQFVSRIKLNLNSILITFSYNCIYTYIVMI